MRVGINGRSPNGMCCNPRRRISETTLGLRDQRFSRVIVTCTLDRTDHAGFVCYRNYADGASYSFVQRVLSVSLLLATPLAVLRSLPQPDLLATKEGH